MLTHIEEDHALNHILIPHIEEFKVLSKFNAFPEYLEMTIKELPSCP
jgi:hypothetical protein